MSQSSESQASKTEVWTPCQLLNKHLLQKKHEVESPFSPVDSVGSVLLRAMRCSDSLTHVAAWYHKGQVTDRGEPYSRSLVCLAPVIRNSEGPEDQGKPVGSPASC